MRPYFAYASNIVKDAMEQRCPTARVVGMACLRHYRFRIVRSGYASAVPERNAMVYGILWLVGPADERALDAYEEIARGLYRRTCLTVEPVAKPRGGSQRMAALVYLASDASLGWPRPGYLEPIVAAAREYGFPRPALADIAR